MTKTGLMIVLALLVGCDFNTESTTGSDTTDGVVEHSGSDGTGTDTDDGGNDDGTGDGTVEDGQGYLDRDHDGHFDGRCDLGQDEDCVETDEEPDEGNSDCNDDDPDTYPGAEERCDGIDNNCDGQIDNDAVDAGEWYRDADGDSWGNTPVIACEQPEGTVETDGDCDDADGNVNPEGVEICDGLDNNCDGVRDNNATDAQTWYIDDDGDGYGDTQTMSCSQPTGTVEIDGDCDDTNADVNPGERETAEDGVDTDCDGSALTAETTDTDGDGTNDYLDNSVVALDCSNVSVGYDTVDFGSSDGYWYSTTGWWGDPACNEITGEDVESMLLVSDSVPDQDVWFASMVGAYATAIDDDDGYETSFGMVFGYVDDDNYSLVYYNEEAEELVFEQWVSGSLNEYETGSSSGGLSRGYLASIDVEVYEWGGTPYIDISVTDLVGSAGTMATINTDLDSFWGNLEGQFGAYSAGGTTYFDSDYFGSYVEGAAAP